MEMLSLRQSRPLNLKYPMLFGTVAAAAGLGLWWFYLRRTAAAAAPATSVQRGRPVRLRKRGKLSSSSSNEIPVTVKSPSPKIVASPPAVHSPSPSPPPLAAATPPPSSGPPKQEEIRKLFLEIEKAKQTGQFAKAAELNRKLIPMIEARFGPYTKNTFSAYQLLVEILLHTDRLSEAEPVALKSLEIARNLPAPENEVFLSRVLAQLGDILLRLDRAKESIPYGQEALEIYQKLGDDSDKLGMVSWNLGLAHARLRKYADAELNMRRALLVFASDSKLVLTCKLSLLGVLSDAGKQDTVNEMYNEISQQLFGAHASETDFFVPIAHLICRNLLDRKYTQWAAELVQRAQAIVEANENTRELGIMFISDLVAVRREEDREEEAATLEKEKVLPLLRRVKTILPPLTLSKYLRSMQAMIRNTTSQSGKGEYILSLTFRDSLPLPAEPDTPQTRLEAGSKLFFEFQNPRDASAPLKHESVVTREKTVGLHIVEYKSELTEGFVGGEVYEATIRVENAAGQLLGYHRQYFRYLSIKP